MMKHKRGQSVRGAPDCLVFTGRQVVSGPLPNMHEQADDRCAAELIGELVRRRHSATVARQASIINVHQAPGSKRRADGYQACMRSR
jgi:hypothetical protein